MTWTSELISTYSDIFKLGFDAGYQKRKNEEELEALKNITSEDIAKIVEKSTIKFKKSIGDT